MAYTKFVVSIVIFLMVNGGCAKSAEKESPVKHQTSAAPYNCDTNNPCNPLLMTNQYYYEHASKKNFVQCDDFSGCFVMTCGPGTVWNQEAYACVHGSGDAGVCGYDCDVNNPCNPLIVPGQYYYEHINIHNFVQCDDFGGCFVMPCAPGTVWDQDAYACVHESDSDGGDGSDSDRINCGFNCDSANPCSPDLLVENQYYYRYSDIYHFVQCDDFGGCFIMPCADGTVWSQEHYTCVHA